MQNKDKSHWLSSLNDAQFQAVTTVDKPLLVLSGAGTGKTKVLTSKIAYLLTHEYANQENILAVTFSNRAANEMRNRIINLIGDVPRLWMGTFHSVCVRILRLYGQYIGVVKFLIIDPDDQKKIVKDILIELNIDKKLTTHFVSHISLMKDTMECFNIDAINAGIYDRIDDISEENCDDFSNLNEAGFGGVNNLNGNFGGNFAGGQVNDFNKSDIEHLEFLKNNLINNNDMNNCLQEEVDANNKNAQIKNSDYEKIISERKNKKSHINLQNLSQTSAVVNDFIVQDFQKKLKNEFAELQKMQSVVSTNLVGQNQGLSQVQGQNEGQNQNQVQDQSQIQNQSQRQESNQLDNSPILQKSKNIFEQVEKIIYVDNQYHTIYKLYQEKLKNLNAMDFGDLILNVIKLFHESPIILNIFRNKFKYILVDEYQDTNVSQYLLIKMLTPYGKGLCCVGDDDQSIYSWRGAEIDNILKFEKDFNNAQTIRLEQNYRSTGNILAAASSIIEHNSMRLGKTLWTEDVKGEKVKIYHLPTGFAEAKFVAEEIYKNKICGDIKFNDIAILVRTVAQTRELEEKLIAYSIPYKVIGGLRFYERLEIKDMVAYLRLIAQPGDNLAFERIINTPKRGIGQSALRHLQTFAQQNFFPLFYAAQRAEEIKAIRPSVQKALLDFTQTIKKIQNTFVTPYDITNSILTETQYLEELTRENTTEAMGRIENIKELLTAMQEFETLEGFLDHVSLILDVTDDKNQDDLVTIMTMHAAKGLEYHSVFLVGWEEGLFPHRMSIDEGNIEEERRLAYVAITRARRRAIIVTTKMRKMYSQWMKNTPSRFLDEIDKQYCVVFNKNPDGGDGGGRGGGGKGVEKIECEDKNFYPSLLKNSLQNLKNSSQNKLQKSDVEYCCDVEVDYNSDIDYDNLEESCYNDNNFYKKKTNDWF